MALATLTDVRDACNITASDSSKDGWLIEAIDAATEVVQEITGVVEATTLTATLSGGGVAVVLPETPTSVTSVVVDGDAWTEHSVSGAVVYAGSGRSVRRTQFPPGAGNVVVSYQCGEAAVPAAVKMALCELVRHWFQNGQQGSRPAFGGSATEVPGAPYAVPRRVVELLEPFAKARKTGMA